MRKKIITVLLGALIMGQGFAPSVYAATDKKNDLKSMSSKNLNDELRLLEKKYDGVKFNSEIKPSKYIELNSIQELEGLIKAMKNSQYLNSKKRTVINSSTYNMNNFEVLASDTNKIYKDVHLWTKWVPYDGFGLAGLTTTRNISFNYTYKYGMRDGMRKKEILTVTNLEAWLGGFDFVTWINKSEPVIDINGSNVKIKIVGEMAFGIVIKGQSYTGSIPQKWELIIENL